MEDSYMQLVRNSLHIYDFVSDYEHCFKILIGCFWVKI